MNNPDIRLDETDLTLIVEVARMGVASLSQMAFATGDFSGKLPARVWALTQAKVLAQFGTEASLGEDSYCATAEGLVSAYMHGAYLRCRQSIAKDRPLKMRRMKLRQRHVLRGAAPELGIAVSEDEG